MQPPLLHLPLDYEMRADLRMLAIKLGGDESKMWAAVYFARLWCDWGRNGVEWRALDTPFSGDDHQWDKDTLTHIVEDVCGWRGDKGGLMKAAVASGVMIMQKKGDLWGVCLNEFWRHNAHLDPDYVSIQKRGGHAKAQKFAARQLEEMAGQQSKILQGQLELPPSKAVTPDEQKRAIGLIMRMDRACGLPVRASSLYSNDLVLLAVEVVRRYGSQQIGLVEAYLQKNRENLEVVKVPDRVIAEFDNYYAKAE